jgi:hypothetical protein
MDNYEACKILQRNTNLLFSWTPERKSVWQEVKKETKQEVNKEEENVE